MAQKRFIAKNGLDNNAQTITNVATPVNTTDAVTKAYADLKPDLSSTTPAALGVAAVGTGTTAARADHVHTLPSLATLGAQAAGSYVTVGGALGTPSSGTLTNCTFPTLNQNTTGNAATATTATNQSGGTVSATTGSFSGTMTLPTGAGSNYIKAGTGDGASFTTYNLKINSWWGIGFGDYQDLTTVKAYINCRNGDIGTSGAFVGNVTGNISGSSGSCTGNAATATTATNLLNGTVTSYGSSSFNFSHGQNLKVGLPAANNGAGTGDAYLYLWTSEPGTTWTGGGIARNMANTNGSFPRVNTGLWGQFIHFEEGGAISFQIENTSGTRYYPLTLTNGNVSSAGTISGTNITSGGNVTGSSTSCTGNAATATLATKASTLSQSGGNGTAMTFNWAGQGGQPNWLWGGNDGSNHYVYNPSNFSVNYATSSGSCTGNAATSSDSLGNGQTWQNVLASRAKNTTYTNSTGRSIMVNIAALQTGSSPLINCQGITVAVINGSGTQNNVSFICPSGGTYIYSGTGGTLTYWAELR